MGRATFERFIINLYLTLKLYTCFVLVAAVYVQVHSFTYMGRRRETANSIKSDVREREDKRERHGEKATALQMNMLPLNSR